MTENSDINDCAREESPVLLAGARIVSFLFNPLLVPSYCAWMAMWGTTLSWLPGRTRWVAVIFTLLFTGIIPLGFIAAMRFGGRVSDMGLYNRRQRLLPYMAGALCYASACFYFYKAHAPEWFYMFFAGAGVAVLVSLVVSLKWKISAHGAVMGGWIAMVLRIMTGPYVTVDMASFTFPCVVIFTGAVCTSRLILRQHTPMQLLAGVVNGFVCVWFCTAVSPQY